MQTLLSRFCEEFVRILHPVLPPLGRAADAISETGDDAPCKALQSQLVDLRHQLELLAEKVSAQQAYVLIFGPLKSGKSTLMNAIAGSYVSEVSSLPAYPCMVFVSHAPEREFVLTRYSGAAKSFKSPLELKDNVDKAHSDLASRIRATEKGGSDFDPRVHFQEAISRIDVKVPTKELGQSRAVLVDTPGLYSRMKFGYDRMTREFRDAAACAIFVVRSDNLFLDQVFAEFTDLLELFSRIFLVVNIDSRKQDLGPDGDLIPSLEQQHPERIIEAFESLAMSAPLAEAAKEGRLRIYPVDLLRAAHGRVGKGNADDRKGFDGFITDLTEYLNSSDYLVSFLGDSLRRAISLADETSELCARKEVRALRDEVTRLERDQRSEESRRHAIERLEGAGWTKRFDALGRELAAACQSIADDIGDKAARAVNDLVSAWFKNRDSLQKLAKEDLVVVFQRYQEELTAAVSKELSDRLVKTGMGVELPEHLTDALAVAEIDLVSICREAHAKTDRNALITVPPSPLRSDDFKVRRGILDWLLLRGQASLQRRLFGPPSNPALSISPETKAARLGQAAQVEMRSRLESYRRTFFQETTTRIIDGFARGYCRIVLDDLTRTVHKGRNRVENKLEEIEAFLTRYQAVLGPLDELARHTKGARERLGKLTEHYEDVDLFLLTQPVMPGYQIPAKAPVVTDHANGNGRIGPPVAPERETSTLTAEPPSRQL